MGSANARASARLKAWSVRLIRRVGRERIGWKVWYCRRCKRPVACDRGCQRDPCSLDDCGGKIVALERAPLATLVRLAEKAKMWARVNAPHALTGAVARKIVARATRKAEGLMETFFTTVEVHFGLVDRLRVLCGRPARLHVRLEAIDAPPYDGPCRSDIAVSVDPVFRRHPPSPMGTTEVPKKPEAPR